MRRSPPDPMSWSCAAFRWSKPKRIAGTASYRSTCTRARRSRYSLRRSNGGDLLCLPVPAKAVNRQEDARDQRQVTACADRNVLGHQAPASIDQVIGEADEA